MDRARIEKISKALADETRLFIFESIGAHPEMTCTQIVDLKGVTPATVSHHLKILTEADLITCERKGQFVFSRVNPKTISEYTKALAALVPGRRK
jgi:ArsR family transcriptional regulator, arsenate/arsenite/antimonite-responsive transcriptional repressor